MILFVNARTIHFCGPGNKFELLHCGYKEEGSIDWVECKMYFGKCWYFPLFRNPIIYDVDDVIFYHPFMVYPVKRFSIHQSEAIMDYMEAWGYGFIYT